MKSPPKIDASSDRIWNGFNSSGNCSIADSMTGWANKTVSELKEELRTRGMPVSGSKASLISRLQQSEVESDVIEAEIVNGQPNGKRKSASKLLTYKFSERVKGLPTSVIIVTAILIVGTTGGGLLFGKEIANWARGETEYDLIEFDANQTRSYAQGLVDLGFLIIAFLFFAQALMQSGINLSLDQSPPPITLPALATPKKTFFLFFK